MLILKFKRKLVKAKEKREKLDEEIGKLENELQRTRLMIQQHQSGAPSGPNTTVYSPVEKTDPSGNQDATTPSDRLTHILENRLHKALVRYNLALSQNKHLRMAIDNLRLEKATFESVYHGYQADLSDTKGKITKLVETSNAAHEDREDAQVKIRQLTDRAMKEEVNFETEVRELERSIEQERKLKEFLATKSMIRGTDPGSLEKVRAAKCSARNDKAQEKKSEAKALRDLQAETNMTDSPDMLFDYIQQLRRSNFTLFIQAKDMLFEHEMLVQELSSLQARRDMCIEKSRITEEQNLDAIEHINNQRLVKEEKKASVASKLNDVRQTLDQVTNDFYTISDIFAKHGIDCKDKSVLSILSEFEQKVLKFHQEVPREQSMHNDIEDGVGKVETLRLPSMGDNDFEDGWQELAESRPLSLDEIKERAQASVMNSSDNSANS